MANKLISYPQYVLGQILDIVFPKICTGCGRFTRHGDFSYVCRKCFGGIEIKSRLECIGCKRQTDLGLTCAFCKKENSVDQLIIAADLKDKLVDKMIKTYKYKFVFEMYKPLAILAKKSIKKLLLKRFNLFEDNPLIVAVPLHRVRFNERGFNQSQLIAKSISDIFHIEYAPDVLTRKYNSKNQADIKARENRLNNVRDNFRVNNTKLTQGRVVVLVDDICTTGATLNECAKVLKNPPTGEGAERVIGFVLARG